MNLDFVLIQTQNKVDFSFVVPFGYIIEGRFLLNGIAFAESNAA